MIIVTFYFTRVIQINSFSAKFTGFCTVLWDFHVTFQVKMSKRGADDGGNGSSQPPIKKVHFEPHLIGPVSTLEEMDIKVLQFQNKKLAQVLGSLVVAASIRK